jgi:hypothetical protein
VYTVLNLLSSCPARSSGETNMHTHGHTHIHKHTHSHTRQGMEVANPRFALQLQKTLLWCAWAAHYIVLCYCGPSFHSIKYKMAASHALRQHKAAWRHGYIAHNSAQHFTIAYTLRIINTLP